MKQILYLAAVALALAMPAAAMATPKPEPTPPAPSPAPAKAKAGAKAGVNATTASQAVSGSSLQMGDVAPSQQLAIDGSDSSSSRFLSLAVAPPAFTPQMAKIDGCAPLITQGAKSGWTIIGGYSSAEGKTDPTDCTLIALRNDYVEQCQYGSAKQVNDLLTKKLLPGFKASDVVFVDLDPKACAALKAPPAVDQAKPVNHLYSLVGREAPPAATAASPGAEPAPQVCTPAPAPPKAPGARQGPRRGGRNC